MADEKPASKTPTNTVPGPGQFATEAPRDTTTGKAVQPTGKDKPTSGSDALGSPVLSKDAPASVVGRR